MRINIWLKHALPRKISAANWLHKVLRDALPGIAAAMPLRSKCSKMVTRRAYWIH